MIFLEDPILFSPLNVIHHAIELNKALSSEQKNTKQFRKVIEANVTAIMLTGLIASSNKEYWMQIVDDKDESPDIRTFCYADQQPEKFDNMEQEDVEVVEYEDHSTIPLPDFLAKTKFAKKKSYDDKTHILCHLGGNAILSLPDEQELEKQMSTIDSPCPVVLLAKTSLDLPLYKLIQLNPQVRVITEFNLEEELHKRKYVGVLTLKRGSRRPSELRPEEKHYPFEKLGYIPDKNGKY